MHTPISPSQHTHNGRWTKTQVTPRPETIKPEVGSSMSKCAQKKAEQRWHIEESNIRAARQKRKMFDIPPNEMQNIDAIIPNARKKLQMPVETAMPCVTQACISTAKTPTQKVAVSKEGGERLLAFSEGRLSLSLTKRERTIKTFGSQRCIRHKGRNCPREDHVADRYILLCNKQSHENSNRKTAPDKVCDKFHTSPCLDCFFLHRQRQLLLHAHVDDINIAGRKADWHTNPWSKLSKVSTPCLDDHDFANGDFEILGELADACAKQQWDIEKNPITRCTPENDNFRFSARRM